MDKNKFIIPIGLGALAILGTGAATLFYKSTIDNQEETSSNNSSSQKADYITTEQPNDAVRLIFIHHSTGENWLSDYDGKLGIALQENNYFVSDTNYGWGPDSIGDSTDIGNWWEWFRGSNSNTYMEALYSATNKNSDYSRLDTEPSGENEIIIFKSCFPNSDLKDEKTAPIPSIGHNELKSQDAYSDAHTVANAKGIYVDILEYFESQQDKLFVIITAPPLSSENTSAKNAANARHFNNWLVNDWLAEYEYDNLAVFDFYDVLTGYGNSDYAMYTVGDGDDHPSTEGNQMATEDFVPFLNNAYAVWRGGN